MNLRLGMSPTKLIIQPESLFLIQSFYLLKASISTHNAPQRHLDSFFSLTVLHATSNTSTQSPKYIPELTASLPLYFQLPSPATIPFPRAPYCLLPALHFSMGSQSDLLNTEVNHNVPLFPKPSHRTWNNI